MDRTKFSKNHILVATIGIFVGFFMGLGVYFMDSLGILIGLLDALIMLEASFNVVVIGGIALMFIVLVISIISSIFFGWLFYRKQQNKFGLACGTTFGSFLATSLFFLIGYYFDGQFNQLGGFQILSIFLTVLISVALIILPKIPDRFACRS